LQWWKGIVLCSQRRFFDEAVATPLAEAEKVGGFTEDGAG
jgi:hypothetical protein